MCELRITEGATRLTEYVKRLAEDETRLFVIENETRLTENAKRIAEESYKIKPLTPTSDQDRISPYDINTISSRQ